MIISEKQIMTLLRLLQLAIQDDFKNSRAAAIVLLDRIYNQQSEELKVIE